MPIKVSDLRKSKAMNCTESSLKSPACFVSQAALSLSDAFALSQAGVNQILEINLCICRTTHLRKWSCEQHWDEKFLPSGRAPSTNQTTLHRGKKRSAVLWYTIPALCVALCSVFYWPASGRWALSLIVQPVRPLLGRRWVSYYHTWFRNKLFVVWTKFVGRGSKSRWISIRASCTRTAGLYRWFLHCVSRKSVFAYHTTTFIGWFTPAQYRL